MKVPDSDAAVVPECKLVDYILSSSHPTGRHKAAFFARFGFRADNWRVLRAALREHLEAHEVASQEQTPFGLRYTVDGPLQ